MRLAHFSDPHVTISPLDEPLGLLHLKRALGTVNYFGGGRWRHFQGSAERMTRLLQDVDAQNVSHVLCTGDLTTMSFDREFQRMARLFAERLEMPERYTVLPGNHDRYTQAAMDERRFER